MTSENRQFHPYAACFDLLPPEELEALADDIRANGLQIPIVEDENGLILDGRNRYKACLLAGVKPHYQKFVGDDAAKLALIKSLNDQRRHLTDSQRAIAGEKLANCLNGTNQFVHKEGASTEAPSSEKVSQQKAADAAGTSRASIQRVRKVRQKGTPELVAAMESGEVSVRAADEIASLPKDEQAKAVEEKKDAKKNRVLKKKPASQRKSSRMTEKAKAEDRAEFRTKFQIAVEKLSKSPPLKEEEFYEVAGMSKAMFNAIVAELHYMIINRLSNDCLVLEVNIEDRDLLVAVRNEVDRLVQECPSGFKFNPKACKASIQRLYRIVDKATTGKEPIAS